MNRRNAVIILSALLSATCGGGGARVELPDGAAPAQALAPIPAPSGPFAIGSLLLDVDDPRPAELLPEGLPRVVEAQIWYPSARDAGGERMPYFPRASIAAHMIERDYLRQPPGRITQWATYGAHAERGALPSAQSGGFPLLLFTPSPPVPVQHYTALLQDLASRGFVVLAVEPRVARADGIRRSSYFAIEDDDGALRAADLALVMRRFMGSTGSVAAVAQRADLTRAGILGHAEGADVVLELCRREAVIARCATLGGYPADGQAGRAVVRPLLVLRGGTALDDERVETDTRARWLSFFAASGANAARLYRLDGAGYLSATDAAWLMPEANASAGAGSAPGRMLSITGALLSNFFGADQAPLDAVDSAAAAYPELLVES